VSELFLALDGAETHAVPYCHHGVRRWATHVTLYRREPGNSPTDDVSLQRSHDAGHHPTRNVSTALPRQLPEASRTRLCTRRGPAKSLAFPIFLFAVQPNEFFLDGLKKLEQRSHMCVWSSGGNMQIKYIFLIP
jgi:hypothetical protein